ncbi:solute carrier family 45 member 3 [Trichomycterus rosablanca]|uniref:solute carrier family 45 member 3 n=1 Tax=Trichomycterus rosablanca TaxID=2290929 RepID=UPI002F35E656
MCSRLSDLFLVNILAFGLEICLATSVIYIPPMLLEAGVQERFMTMVLGVGPILGLIFVPPLGSASDGWSSRYGRRRPFIWALSVGVLLGLMVIPHASQIASFFAKKHQNGLNVLLLVSAMCVLEFCGQACFTHLEALVSDLYPGEKESHRAFSVLSLMVSIGGCVGYLLPAVDWSSLSATAYLGSQEAFIYALFTVLFLICLMTTAFIPEKQTLGGATETSRKSPVSFYVCCWPSRMISRVHILTRSLFGLTATLPRIFPLCTHMPKVIKRLFMAKLCSWMGILTFMLFYTDFVGERLYDGLPSAKPGSPERLRYEKGVQMASVGLFLQCVTSVFFSLLMERMVARVGARIIYLSSMVLLTLSTAVMIVSKNIVLVTAMTTATGFTYSTLQILPYTLTCLYHSDKQVFFSSNKHSLASSKNELDMNKSTQIQSAAKYRSTNGCLNGHPVGTKPATPATKPPTSATKPSTTKSAALHSTHCHISLQMDTLSGLNQPPRGMGLDLAILDSAYLLSQVVPSLFMGTIVQLFSSVTAYMVCASVLSLLAVYFSSRVVFNREDMETLG